MDALVRDATVHPEDVLALTSLLAADRTAVAVVIVEGGDEARLAKGVPTLLQLAGLIHLEIATGTLQLVHADRTGGPRRWGGSGPWGQVCVRFQGGSVFISLGHRLHCGLEGSRQALRSTTLQHSCTVVER